MQIAVRRRLFAHEVITGYLRAGFMVATIQADTHQAVFGVLLTVHPRLAFEIEERSFCAGVV